MHSSEKSGQVQEMDWSQQVEHMQFPNGTIPGVRRSARPLSPKLLKVIVLLIVLHV